MPVEETNVNEDELAKFEAMAHRWWDKESEFKALHDINPLRLNYIDGHTGLNGKKVLDVGCGGGILSESMVKRGAQVTGIDVGKTSLAVAKIHAREQGLNIEYQAISAEDLAAQKLRRFDVVTCMEILEHVPNPATLVKACSRLVKPRGQVFFATINRNPKSFLFAIIGAEYVLNLLPRGTHEYKQLIRPSELDRWVRHAHMRTTEIMGMSYNPLKKSYALSTDISVNYIVHAQKL